MLGNTVQMVGESEQLAFSVTHPGDKVHQHNINHQAAFFCGFPVTIF
jgi:hypothetical protein